MNEYIIEQEIMRRRDMRDVLTFTIDPDTAKDFDDAVSFQEMDNGLYQVGVHIADVSYFVKRGSATDLEAYEKGTSVYLVDEVRPMLPEKLCNDLCSLMEGQDRLCVSVIFTIDDQANTIKSKVSRTVIRSNARLTYGQAQQLLTDEMQDGNELQHALKVLWSLAAILRQDRIKSGALSIEQDEVKFTLDEDGQPVDIYLESPGESNFLIEELMLLANKTVAFLMRNKPFIYRVHDKPEKEKMEQLKNFKKLFKPITTKQKNVFHERLIDMMTIRSMAKAEYSTRNIGHYGLAFQYYTHFTSPIRRYPDLIVHRLLARTYFNSKEEIYSLEELTEISKHCSECEETAQHAERDSIKKMQLLWLNNYQDKIFTAHIVSVVEYGFFVQLEESLCEGLVHIRQLFSLEHFDYIEEEYQWRSESGRWVFTIGDEVQVKIELINFEKNIVDFEIVLPDVEIIKRPQQVPIKKTRNRGRRRHRH